MIFDTGPLFAAMDRADKDHQVCARFIESLDEAVLVPAPVLVEVDWLAGQRLHPDAFLNFLADIETGVLRVVDLEADDFRRVRELLDRYRDLALGFVDAAVLAVVERLNETKLATLDHRHFTVLRPRHLPALRLLP